MKKILKNKCSLEEEYAFEHMQRIKAENYISELWEMHGELENEVSKLQKIINDNGYTKEIKAPLSKHLELNNRIDKIHKERECSFSRLPILVKKAFK